MALFHLAHEILKWGLSCTDIKKINRQGFQASNSPFLQGQAYSSRIVSVEPLLEGQWLIFQGLQALRKLLRENHSSSFKTLNNLGHTFPILSSFPVVFTSSITDILSSKISFVHTRSFICSLFSYLEGSFLVFPPLCTYPFLHSPVQPKLALPRLC